MFKILFCSNGFSQTINQINDSTFLIDRPYAEFIAESLDSLDYYKGLSKACDNSLIKALSFKDACNKGREICEKTNIKLTSKNEALSLIVTKREQQIQILEKSILLKDKLIIKQKRRNKAFKIGLGSTAALTVGYIIFSFIK